MQMHVKEESLEIHFFYIFGQQQKFPDGAFGILFFLS
jgi:hypothetical protein